MILSLKRILESGYSDVAAQKILDDFHMGTPNYMKSYRIYDGERGNGGKVTRIVRVML